MPDRAEGQRDRLADFLRTLAASPRPDGDAHHEFDKARYGAAAALVDAGLSSIEGSA